MQGCYYFSIHTCHNFLYVDVSSELIYESHIVFMHLSWLGVQTLELKVLPDFEPNDYLFANHADKGEERWQIYAWAVKDIMAKAGNFGKSE